MKFYLGVLALLAVSQEVSAAEEAKKEYKYVCAHNAYKN